MGYVKLQGGYHFLFGIQHPASPFFWLGKAAPRFGNLIETMISLWSAVSGGNDWMNYGELLRCGKFKWWTFDWNLGNRFGIEMEILPYFSYTPGLKKRSSSPKAP